jgi:hypothetical protein
MADEILKRDENSSVVLGGITDDSSQYIRMLRVNPITGRLLVSDTGGSGGNITLLPATGTVDGTNLSFTFTAEPIFIISDGAWYAKLDNNGNTQWSWNGVDTVTMIIPPSTYISGILFS